MNFGSDCRWQATEHSVLFMHWEEDTQLKTAVFLANDYQEHIGEIAVIADGKIVKWETEEQ